LEQIEKLVVITVLDNCERCRFDELINLANKCNDGKDLG